MILLIYLLGMSSFHLSIQSFDQEVWCLGLSGRAEICLVSDCYKVASFVSSFVWDDVFRKWGMCFPGQHC